MRGTAFLILSLAVITGCGGQSPSVPATVVEAQSPAVGADGKLAESIGIETLGGVFTPLLSRGTAAPCSVSETFSTATDNQSHILLKPYRGTARLVAECHLLGPFQVTGVPPAPRGTPQIEVTLAVQDRRILLSARNLATGESMQISR
jgi:molecular chaperone DnaK (HSP70)